VKKDETFYVLVDGQTTSAVGAYALTLTLQ
jgi:hypothetical protein